MDEERGMGLSTKEQQEGSFSAIEYFRIPNAVGMTQVYSSDKMTELYKHTGSMSVSWF